MISPILVWSPLFNFLPLKRLFSETKAVASGRIQRWAFTLSSYEYELKYRQSKIKETVTQNVKPWIELGVFPSSH